MFSKSSALQSPTNKYRSYVELKAPRHERNSTHQIEKEDDMLKKEANLLLLKFSSINVPSISLERL